uniref:Uncharacterized protein n=1 Tax=Panagrolaimus superbus TaxID=310955 RepID=A0A914ZCH6_9BILA
MATVFSQHSQRRGKDTYLIDALFEEIVPNETHYKLQKALMSFAALDVEKPFGNFLRQMINLDPHERAPIGLMLEHPYLRCPSIHLKKQFYAS